MLEQPVTRPRAVWVTFPRFHHPDQTTDGFLHAWRRDEHRDIWEAMVSAVRETAPGFTRNFYDWTPASRVRSRD